MVGCEMIVHFSKDNQMTWVLDTIDFRGANQQAIERPWCEDIEKEFIYLLKLDGFQTVKDMAGEEKIFKETRSNVLELPCGVDNRNNWTDTNGTHQIDTISCRRFFNAYLT